MKILFVASEVGPFVRTGGLGDVAAALPAALARLGHEVCVVTPRYAQMRTDGLGAMGAEIEVPFPFGAQRAQLLGKRLSPNHRVVFLEHPGFYGRSGVYGDANGDYPDNARRFAFLSFGALAAAQALKFEPDIIHLNDWQTGLAAAQLRRGAGPPVTQRARTLFTIHNLAYQGNFASSAVGDLGLPPELFDPEGLELYGEVSFLKAGLVWSDALNTVSPRYAEEIKTTALGNRLDGLLRARADRLSGILNGIDDVEWNPTTDPHIVARYSPDALGGKADCKRALRERFGLRGGKDRPLFGWISRLVAQKGVDLLIEALPRMMEADVEVALLGNGEKRYESALLELGRRYAGRLGVVTGFDNALSHWVEAGSDFFLMPSLFEPCGLNQMYSLRYGTLPVVHATGGLDDTVIDAAKADGNGFKFEDADVQGLLWAVGQARDAYQSADWMRTLRQRGMRQDFSWKASAQRYLRLYRSLHGE